MIKKKKNQSTMKKHFFLVIILALVGFAIFYFTKNLTNAISISATALIIIEFYNFITYRMQKSVKIKKMEDAFPDFIDLMSSNLRAGMTVDKAILLSSRKEFSPLDEEILSLGKDIMTGKEINQALLDMGERIGSEKIKKTIEIIISGIKSGGNISILLEETASSMRERDFVEKRAASNVLMYVIFIFFAAAVGAPVLFGLSTILVQVLTQILSNIPDMETTHLAFTLTKVSISPAFINYFSIAFIIVTDIMASFLIGLVNKGEEKSGVKYMIPLIIISLIVFFLIRIVLTNYFAAFMG